MKNKIIFKSILLSLPILLIISGCTKLLDKHPQTEIVTASGSANTISATDAENAITGLYNYYKLDRQEFTVFDRIINGDAIADNCYAGGDNTDNITLDNFTANSLNGNVNRDWVDGFGIIGNANTVINQVENSVDPSFNPTRKNQILGEARFIRAYTYFDLVRLYGRVPVSLKVPNTKTGDSLAASLLIPQSSPDTVYKVILNDLWFAKATVQDIGAQPSKYIVSKGTVNAALAKVYASMPTPQWDSVSYYCDQVIPNYSLLPQFSYLWDNAHKDNNEAIWELSYPGWIPPNYPGDWVPSIHVGGSIGSYDGGGWKKFNTPTNDLVNAFLADGDSIRLNNSITFLDISGQWTDKYWTNYTHYPFLTKFNDPSNGTNDFYIIRLADILLLKAEALVEGGDINGALTLVNQVRTRVGLTAKTASSADEAKSVIANERRLELAFEGHRWFDLLRTGQAITVMNAQKDGNGNSLNYDVQPFRLLLPIPQQQIDLNPLLTQNPDY